MTKLAIWLAETIAARVAESTGNGESRLIFHGPPLEILEVVYAALVQADSGLTVPVLLQIDALPAGGVNPRIGRSGLCDETHLLDLRNSPQASSYLALVPPGQRAIRSVSSTTDEFGLGTASDSANIPFEDWWADPFVQAAVTAALERSGLAAGLHGQAGELIHRAARAFDEVDPARSSRRGAWRLISRLFSISGCGQSPAMAISLACGVPPMDSAKLSATEQQASLDGVALALSEGFRAGLEGALKDATPEHSIWLQEFLKHIQTVCDVPTALERAPEAFYRPADGLELQVPPQWWVGLTTDAWATLLSDEPEIAGDIILECANALLPPSRGTPLLVERDVQLIVRVGAETTPVHVHVERSPGKTVGGFPAVLLVDGERTIEDDAPPKHRSPVQYKATAEHHRPASIKVISLAEWQAGIFVACRLARKLTPPKAPARRARGANFETSLSLPGPGRYELLVFHSPDVAVADRAVGIAGGEGTGSEDSYELAVREIQAGRHQIEVEVDGSHQVDIHFRRNGTGGAKTPQETCRIFLSCDDIIEDGCRSEFERLIKLNRRQIDPGGSKPIVQLNRSARTSTLQGWMLQDSEVRHSFLPIVLADDYSDHWVQPKWLEETGRILSGGRFLKDPRPPASHFDPPEVFVSARRLLAEMIRGIDDQSGLIEAVPLGEWLRRREDFPELVERYLDAYANWLSASPEIARWVDVVVVASLEPGGRTISRVPDAILLSPLHPVRLVWHAVAQSVMDASATSSRPCPAVGILDPGVVPDILRMPLVSPEGTEQVSFVSVESNSDYWSVLWNGARLGDVAHRSKLEPFGPALGISVGGISAGFSAAQVRRALEDVSNVLCAKTRLSVLVSSAGGATDSCNEGLVAWSGTRFADAEKSDRRQASGHQRLDVFDDRDERDRPDEATIANLSEDTRNHVRWFAGHLENVGLDLGIIAQLDSSEPEAIANNVSSPLGAGGLLRHRVRRQLPGAFLSESRQSRVASRTGDTLADKLVSCIATLEGGADQPIGLRFAPDVHAISSMLDEKRTDFVAVSSSAVDPACFLGGWLPQSYLWDYDLPSYSQRAGDTNGYYLLSRVKSSDRDSLKKVLSRLPGCEMLADDKVGAVLLEVARRGIPTIRGLAGDDTGATGDLGLFVAARLLQDRFRPEGSANSLLPVLGGAKERVELSLVIPVDPFRGYLDDLARALNRERPDATLSRPDLLVVGILIAEGSTRIHLTPIEVKCRLGATFPVGDIEDALGQAKSLGSLLSALAAENDLLSAWQLAYQHLLLAIIGFGMRVYSQHPELTAATSEWAGFHQGIAEAILGDSRAVTVDDRGRLIIIDDSPVSDAIDRDGDGFEEVIVVGTKDAGRIVAGDAQAFYDGVKGKVADWGLGVREQTSKAVTAKPSVGESEVAEEEGGVVRMIEADVPKDVFIVVPPSSPATSSLLEEEVKNDPNGIRLTVGTTVDGFERREIILALSDTRLNQLNMGVVGDLGTGKTQLLKSLVHQIAGSGPVNRGVSPRMLIFDYKRDYSSADFVAATGARVVRPHKLPLNLFDTAGMEDTPVPWLDRFRFFADVLDKIYSGIGPVQRDKLKKAVKSAYETQVAGAAPTIYNVHAAYANLLEGKSDSPMAIIDDLVDMEIFEHDPTKCVPFDKFMDGVIVISLDALGQDDRSKNMLVAVMLNMFYENMLRTPKRPFIGSDPQLRAIDSYLLVDEADNIMRYEFDVLRKLLLQGREFGCGVILASQYLRHFKVNSTDYREPLLTWFIHKVPNVIPAELAALGLAASAAEIAERVKALRNHQCLYKSFDSPGEILRGLPFYELTAREAGGF